MVVTPDIPARYTNLGCENKDVCGHRGPGVRWFCNSCSCDICFTCRPISNQSGEALTHPVTLPKPAAALAPPTGSVNDNKINRAGVPVRLGTGNGANNYYCGRVLGVKLIPFSDGRCGVNNGPQCMDCRGLTRASPPNAETVGLLSAVTVPVVVLYGSPLSVKITS